MMLMAVYGVVLHSLFLLSVFYIYFKSPVLTNLNPQSDLNDAPAKRIVLFVADGLRAEAFFSEDCSRTQFLRSQIVNGAIMGISHTRVPSESRPGHVALIAGFYEDPSCVLRGWQENPIEFDSVFNRSSKTYSWGSPDILPMFAKGAINGRVETFHYDKNFTDFSGRMKTTALDEWVFERVKNFLNSPENFQIIQQKEKLVLFLHLLGMDTAGHVHKPHSNLFIENQIFMDRGIEHIVNLVEKATNNDQKTAFIFTADHGMTDRGSHGAGEPHETETPFIAWGAGVNNWKKLGYASRTDNFQIIDGIRIPRWDINQADVTPLMSSLIGTAVPVNNFGILPLVMVNASEEYVAKAIVNNAFQLFEQYNRWRQISKEKTFKVFLTSKEQLLEILLINLKNRVLFDMGLKKYKNVIESSQHLIESSIEAIEYYQTYYKHELLFALCLTMFGWIFMLVQQVFSSKSNNNRSISQKLRKRSRLLVSSSVLAFGIIIFNILQKTPLLVIIFFLTPIVTWVAVIINHRSLQNIFNSRLDAILFGVVFLVGVEFYVISFFYRQILSAILLLHSIYLFWKHKNQKASVGRLNILWILTSVFVSAFPLMPVVQKDSQNDRLLILGTILWMVKSFDFLLCAKTRKDIYKIIKCLFVTIVSVHFINFVLNSYKKDDINVFFVPTSYIILACSISIFLFSQTTLQNRLTAITSNMSIPFIMMSLTYEPLFLLAYALNLWKWVQMEHFTGDRVNTLAKLSFNHRKVEPREISPGDIRRVYIFMLYLLVSFFGTGNLASVSSFDPNWVRCFVTTFSPFLMSSLIIFKLMIPILILMCNFIAIHVVTQVEMRKLFILILIICDVMCLNFLFLIKNKGSWLDIGVSISHFVIMEVTTIVLIFVYGICNIFTKYRVCTNKYEDNVYDEPLIQITNRNKINHQD